MDNLIAFTPSQLVAGILAIIAFFIAIDNFSGVAIKWFNKAKQPEDIQNERIRVLEEKVAELERGREENKEAIAKMEEGQKKFQLVMVESLQALSEHALDNSPENNKNLKDAITKLNRYLLDH